MKKNLLRLGFIVFMAASHGLLAANSPLLPGSTEDQAREGYAWRDTLGHLNRFRLKNWDLAADETLRYAQLNSPQFFTHAWVHRAGPISELGYRLTPELGAINATTIVGDLSLDQWLAQGPVDGFIVLQGGDILYEQYPRMRAFDKHHWWSVRKPILATLVAMLEDEGRVDVSLPIDHYIGELKGTAWADTPIIDILDMASGTAALEADDEGALSAEQSLYYQYEATVGNRPALSDQSSYDFVGDLPRHRPSGEAFEYSTVNTFVLSWLVEVLTGKSQPEVISERLWQPMGAESDALVMLSNQGAASTINSTLRDMARFGLLFTPSWKKVSRQPIISARYLDRIQHGGRPELYTKGAVGTILTEVFADDPPRHNSYQWDMVMGDGDFFKAGHNGQGLYISPGKDLVIAFFGSGDDSSIIVSTQLARQLAKSIGK